MKPRVRYAGMMATILFISGVLAALATRPFLAGLFFLGWIATSSVFDTLRRRLMDKDESDHN